MRSCEPAPLGGIGMEGEAGWGAIGRQKIRCENPTIARGCERFSLGLSAALRYMDPAPETCETLNEGC